MCDKEELGILSCMYDGDKNRDASDKIRGFIFQDYVAIMSLLEEDVECVCLEYLEDVDVILKNGEFRVIQVKYYPNTNPSIKDISTDLYYQFIRFKMLNSTFQIKPKLYINLNRKINGLTLEGMKKNIGLENNIKKSVNYQDIENPKEWLRENVHKSNKKAEQKEYLFKKMASEESLKDFINQYDVSYKPEINEYKKELKDALASEYPAPSNIENDDKWKSVLLGVAIVFIQKRYTQDGTKFNELKVDKETFDQYMKGIINNRTNQSITGYLVDIICETYVNIINYNNFSDLQCCILKEIYRKTIEWIKAYSETEERQCQLLNTFSTEEVNKIMEYKQKNENEKMCFFAECKRDFETFLNFFWKIMLDICQEKIDSINKIYENLELMNPYRYVDSSITEYICLNFPEDKYIDRTAILPAASQNSRRIIRVIVSRMVNASKKPMKWFFAGGNLKEDKNYYDYSTSDVIEDPTIANPNLGENAFYIECMDCIDIQEGEWNKIEKCDECVFSLKCIKNGDKL